MEIMTDIQYPCSTPYDTMVYFAKVRDNAIIPTKREEDGCYDIYPYFDEVYIKIEPHALKLIPTGIATALDSRYMFEIRERGSNTKSALSVRAGEIDSGFRGEWFIALRNENDIPVYITKEIDEFSKGSKYIIVPYIKAIAQAKLEKVYNPLFNEVTYEELKNIPSERGTGMLGSSGK